ncbi:MAG: PilZ domain-containing protein [Gammaproteobacteria bacterium]|nr:PilZ domain-containing protein [Gammaproteobacteria bacterium]MBQ0840136.1 PilZ domain-containing protein [Gammaproteobacteria bacterium]
MRGIRSGILNLSLKDADELYACYMPFVENGGLFIPSRKQFSIGDEVFVLLELMEEDDKLPLTGKVIWVTPKGTSGNRKQGVGIQFTPESTQVVQRIETYLAGLLSSGRPTNTL